MASSLVIKVQHDGTLRRFNASIKKNGELDLDMVALKTKILRLFDFPADADLNLTYVDEDADVVTLVDDDDLSDVTWQSLAFLRINVVLNNGRVAKPLARTNGGETSHLEDSPVVLKMGLSSLKKVQPSEGGPTVAEMKGVAEVALATKTTAEEHVPPKNMFHKLHVPTIQVQVMGILTMALIGFLLLFLFLLPCAHGPSILTMSPIIILIVLIIIDFTWCDSFNTVDC